MSRTLFLLITVPLGISLCCLAVYFITSPEGPISEEACAQRNEALYESELALQIAQLKQLLLSYSCKHNVIDCSDSESQPWDPPYLPEFKGYQCCHRISKQGLLPLGAAAQKISEGMASRKIKSSDLCWNAAHPGQPYFITCACPL